MTMLAAQRLLNILFIYVLCGVLLGGFIYQFVMLEEPCPLCLLQRLGMIGVATSLLMNLRFGIRVQYYALAILSALSGRLVSLRQISLHVCPEFPTFGEPVLGLDLYVWAFIVFACSIFACAILIILYGYSKQHETHVTWGTREKTAFWLVAAITTANTINTLVDLGLGY